MKLKSLSEQAIEEAKGLAKKYNIIYFALLKKAIDEELDKKLANQ